MSQVLAMCLFSLSMSISPGPVNLITLSSGANHGVARSVPFISGATIGFTVLLYVVGVSYQFVAQQLAGWVEILGVAGNLFIFYMGYRLFSANVTLEVKAQSMPSFLQGAFLQWCNPKAWIACMAGISAFNLSGSYSLLLMFVSIYFVICYASIFAWAVLGNKIALLLKSSRQVRIFNRVMGAMLMLIALYLMVSLFSK